MDTKAGNIEINQDELIIQQQRQIEKEVSKQDYSFNINLVPNKSYTKIQTNKKQRALSYHFASFCVMLRQFVNSVDHQNKN